MTFSRPTMKAIVNITAYDEETTTLTYDFVATNVRTGSLILRQRDVKLTTSSTGDHLFINMNKYVRNHIIKELDLPITAQVRVEIANKQAAKAFLPAKKQKEEIKTEPAKFDKISDTDKKYAVVCQNGVWTIKKFDVPELVTKEEALEILLSK